MKLTPQPGHVLIERHNPTEAATGILLPASKKRLEDRSGRVVAVGDPAQVWSKAKMQLVSLPIEVEAGQFVVFKEHTADVLSIQGRMFFSVDAKDIILSAPDEESFKQLSLSPA